MTLLANFSFFDLVSLTVNPHAKFEVFIFSRSEILGGGSKNLKSRSWNPGNAPVWRNFVFFN